MRSATDWDDAFLRLVLSDEELTRAEFDSLIADVWDTASGD